MAAETRQYIVIVKLRSATPEYLKTLLPPLQKVLGNVSTEPIQLAFRSGGGDHFGFFIRSRLVAGQIRAAIESPGNSVYEEDFEIPPFFGAANHLFVIELGEDFSASSGFAREGTWLQRH